MVSDAWMILRDFKKCCFLRVWFHISHWPFVFLQVLQVPLSPFSYLSSLDVLSSHKPYVCKFGHGAMMRSDGKSDQMVVQLATIKWRRYTPQHFQFILKPFEAFLKPFEASKRH